MREIIFDTETTGLNAREDRVIELGAIELVNRFPTGRTFHVYLNPQGRAIDPEALAIHGISAEQLADKPAFHEVAQDFATFIEGADLIAHNASFDIAFINAEFSRAGLMPVDPGRVVDSLALARRRHPMGPNSLDALCRRYGIDNRHRTKHGALLDSELLAEVYIELIGGKQAALILESSVAVVSTGGQRAEREIHLAARPAPLAPRLSEAEREAHAKLVSGLGEKAVWLKVPPPL